MVCCYRSGRANSAPDRQPFVSSALHHGRRTSHTTYIPAFFISPWRLYHAPCSIPYSHPIPLQNFQRIDNNSPLRQLLFPATAGISRHNGALLSCRLYHPCCPCAFPFAAQPLLYIIRPISLIRPISPCCVHAFPAVALPCRESHEFQSAEYFLIVFAIR